MAIWKTKWGWRAEFEFKGNRYESKAFRYKEEARTWIKEEKERLKSRTSSSSRDDPSFWLLAQNYLADSASRHVKKVVSEKKHCLERFYEHVGDVLVTDITPIQTLEYINQIALARSNYSANRERKNLKAFFRWCQDMYGIMHDPTGPIRKKPHNTKRPRKLISIQDILKVMLVAQGQDRVMVGAYWHTGGRRGEIFRWTWSDDVNFEQRWVRLGTRKSRDGDMTYEKLWMNDDLYELLRWQWKHRNRSSPYVFCEMNPKLKRYGQPYTTRRTFLKGLCKRAGVEPFGFHEIRHSVATYLNDLQKVGLKKVQRVLRHKRQSTTEIYVDHDYSETRESLELLELKNVREISELLTKSPQKSPQNSILDEWTEKTKVP